MTYKAKFPFGSRVLINKNIAGIVLYSHNMYRESHPPFFIYRIIVDANDLCFRVVNNQEKQDAQDTILFSEDFDSLLTTTDQLMVMQIGEDSLSLFEGVVTPLGEPEE